MKKEHMMNQIQQDERKVRAEKRARDIAEFAGVDKAAVVSDFSGKPNLFIVDPDPNLVYRFVRPEKVSTWQSRGYLTRPPDRHGNIAKTSGPTDGMVVMAIHKKHHIKRREAYIEQLNARKKAKHPKKKPWEHLQKFEGHSYYGEEIERKTETVEPRHKED